jgi:hypothetical protein
MCTIHIALEMPFTFAASAADHSIVVIKRGCLFATAAAAMLCGAPVATLEHRAADDADEGRGTQHELDANDLAHL